MEESGVKNRSGPSSGVLGTSEGVLKLMRSTMPPIGEATLCMTACPRVEVGKMEVEKQRG